MAAELKSIGPYVVGQFLGYVMPEPEQPREPIGSRRWHVVQVMTGCELKIAEEIEELGMATYVPKCPHRRISRRLKSPQFMSIFRGYIFAGFDPRGTLWPQLRDIDGIFRVLTIGSVPVSLDEAVMVRIREVEGLVEKYGIEAVIRALKTVPSWELAVNEAAMVPPMAVKVGAIVRIVDCGPFTGLFAPISEIDNRGRRVLVRFAFAGGEAPLWLNEGNFEVV